MVLMPVSLLHCGMVIAKDVETNSSKEAFFPLLRKGVGLTNSTIAKLKHYNIDVVYVEMEGTENIIASDLIESTLKNEVLSHLEKVFKNHDESTRGIAYKLLEETNRLSKKLVDNALNNPEVLISLISLKTHDDYTYTHSLCVALLSITIGISLTYNYTQLQDLSTAALLHDIGKTAIPSSVLNKPGALTENEFALIKTHPDRGTEMIFKMNPMVSSQVLVAINGHHEKYDGTGYPSQMEGHCIHPFAKIIAVADVYDALTSDRSYRKAGQPCDAIEYIMGCANTHFDIEIVNHFLKRVVAYPVGSMVWLSDGRQAVVVENHSANIMRPRVLLIGQGSGRYPELDLLNDLACYNITITGIL